MNFGNRFGIGGVRLVWLACCLLLLPYRAPAALPDPQAHVREVTDQVLEIIRAHRDEFRHDVPALYRAIEEAVLPHFDIETMSRWVLGKHWRRLSASQRERFVRNFKHLLIRTYSTALLEYEDQKIDYLPLRWDGRAERVQVRTRILASDGEPIPVDYRLRWKDGAWKVVDVKIDGMSLVANYRSTFGAEIRGRGIEGLLARLEARVRETAGEGGDRGTADAGG